MRSNSLLLLQNETPKLNLGGNDLQGCSQLHLLLQLNSSLSSQRELLIELSTSQPGETLSLIRVFGVEVICQWGLFFADLLHWIWDV